MEISLVRHQGKRWHSSRQMGYGEVSQDSVTRPSLQRTIHIEMEAQWMEVIVANYVVNPFDLKPRRGPWKFIL